MVEIGWPWPGQVAACVLVLAGATAPSRADPLPAPAASDTLPARIEASRRDLASLESTLSASDAERHRIADEIETIRTDRVRLSAALIDTTQKVQGAEAGVAAIEARLATMRDSQDAIRQSLDSRRGVIAEVLASLQRMGRKPPPAILVDPDDILKTIRTSMLLGAVVPELRAQTEALASDLADLASLRTSIAAERDKLTAEVTTLTGEQHRLDALVEARQAAQADAETSLGSEQGRAADLARQATSLKDLVARMEGEMGSARRAGDAARAADDERQTPGPGRRRRYHRQGCRRRVPRPSPAGARRELRRCPRDAVAPGQWPHRQAVRDPR